MPKHTFPILPHLIKRHLRKVRNLLINSTGVYNDAFRQRNMIRTVHCYGSFASWLEENELELALAVGSTEIFTSWISLL